MRSDRHAARESLLIAVVYSAAWGFMLLASGRYWDDWAALDLSARAVAEWSTQQGLFWQLDLLRFLSILPGTDRLGHILTFVAFLVSALALHRVLLEAPAVSRQARVTIPLLVAVFPVNGARFAHVTLMYAVSLAIFMVAWWMFAVESNRPSLWRWLVASGLLVFAMLSTGSLLMFSVVIPVYVVWVRWPGIRTPNGAISLAIRCAGLLALPVIAWLIRGRELQPSGLYAEYNELTWVSAREAVSALPGAFRASFADAVISSISPWAWIAVLLAPLIYLLMRQVVRNDDRGMSLQEGLATLAAGFVLFMVAVFPYLAVGKMPQAIGWESRHQLLVPFGAALIIYGVTILVGRAVRMKTGAVTLAVCVLLGVFIASDIRTSLVYQGDWYKQVALMEWMKTDAVFESGRFFVFADQAADINAPVGVIARYAPDGTREPVDSAHRAVAFYEYNGMMRHVFGDATRLGIGEDSLRILARLDRYQPFEQYNFWQHERGADAIEVTVGPGERDLRRPGVVIDLMWQEIMAPREFQRSVREAVVVETRSASGLYQ